MSSAEGLGETWTEQIQSVWRKVFDAACKEAGWAPTWKKDDIHGWIADLSDSPLSDNQVLTAINLARKAAGFRPISEGEFYDTR